MARTRSLALGLLAIALATAASVVWLRDGAGAGDPARAPHAPIGETPSRPPVARVESPARPAAGEGAASRVTTDPSEEAGAPAREPRRHRLVRPNGEPIPGAGIVAFVGKRAFDQTETDGAGLFELAEAPPEVSLYLAPRDAVPIVLALAAGAPRDLVVPDDGEIAGEVRADGAPAEGIELQLWFPGFVRARDHPDDFPESDWQNLRLCSRLAATTDASGRFRFGGITPSCAARIELVDGAKFKIASMRGAALRGDSTLAVEGPCSGIALELAIARTITGWIVDDESGEGPVDSTVWCALAGSDPPMSLSVRDGLFKAHFVERGRQRFQLWLEDPETGARPAFEKEVDLREDAALGVVRLPTNRAIELTVVNESGEPIAGARAVAGRVGSEEPSGADGRLVLACSRNAHELWVAARGYRIARVPLPKETRAARRVALERTTCVEVTIPERESQQQGSVSLGVSVTAGPLFEESVESARFRSLPYAVRPDPIPQQGGVGRELSMDHRTPWTLSGLRSGVPIAFEYWDGLGVVAATSVVTLAPGEWRKVLLEPSEAAPGIFGRVVEAGGQPIEGASVGAVPLEGPSNQRCTMTRADGSFAIHGIRRPKIRVEVTMVGFVRESREVEPTAPGVSPLLFTLVRGVDFRVRVDDATGARVEVRNLWCEVPAENTPDIVLSPDEIGVYGVLPRLLGIEFEALGRIWRRTIDPREGTVRIELPAPGKVVLKETASTRLGGVLEAELRADAKDACAVEPYESGSFHGPLFPPGEHRFPKVLPGTYRLRLRLVRERAEPNDPPLAETTKTLEVRANGTTLVEWEGSSK